jgi:Family of unknown function (DUF6204)
MRRAPIADGPEPSGRETGLRPWAPDVEHRPVKIFRVIVRGRFDGLDDAQRAALVGAVDEHDLLRNAQFTQTGAFTYDRQVDFFSYRLEVRVDADEPATARADAFERAQLLAAADLERRGLAWRDLRATGQDMADVWS